MEISKLHIDKDNYNFFTTLKGKEKIEFLHDAQYLGLDISILNRLESNKPKNEDQIQPINDLFQDTVMEEVVNLDGKIIITTTNNYLHLNSNSLKLIRQFVFKLFDDGHIIIRHKNAKKIPSVDYLRYYRCYEIIGSGDPFCPN